MADRRIGQELSLLYVRISHIRHEFPDIRTRLIDVRPQDVLSIKELPLLFSYELVSIV